MKRISLGLVGLFLSLLLLARVIGILPDPDRAAIDNRVAVCEAMAIECSISARQGNLTSTESYIRGVVRRHPEIRSAAVRDLNGRLLVDVGGHESQWANAGDSGSSTTHMSVPISRDDRPWGQVEVCFEPLPFGGFWQYVGGGLLPLFAFVGLGGSVAAWFYLRLGLSPGRSGSRQSRSGSRAGHVKHSRRRRARSGQGPADCPGQQRVRSCRRRRSRIPSRQESVRAAMVAAARRCAGRLSVGQSPSRRGAADRSDPSLFPVGSESYGFGELVPHRRGRRLLPRRWRLSTI